MNRLSPAPLDVRGRLTALGRLERGWLDGKGLAPDGLRWLADAFDRHFPEDLPRSYLYPTAEGAAC